MKGSGFPDKGFLIYLSATLAVPFLFFLTHFEIIYDILLDTPTAMWYLFVNCFYPLEMNPVKSENNDCRRWANLVRINRPIVLTFFLTFILQSQKLKDSPGALTLEPIIIG